MSCPCPITFETRGQCTVLTTCQLTGGRGATGATGAFAGAVYGIATYDEAVFINPCTGVGMPSGTSSLIPFRDPLVGGGMTFDGSNTFTLPVDGTYRANYRILAQPITRPTNIVSLHLLKNSVVVPRSSAATVVTNGFPASFLSGSTIFTAQANDRIALANNTTLPLVLQPVKAYSDTFSVGMTGAVTATNINTASVTLPSIQEGSVILVALNIKGTLTQDVVVSDSLGYTPYPGLARSVNSTAVTESFMFFNNTFVAATPFTVNVNLGATATVLQVTVLEIKNTLSLSASSASTSLQNNQSSMANSLDVTFTPITATASLFNNQLEIITIAATNYQTASAGTTPLSTTPIYQSTTGDFLGVVAIGTFPSSNSTVQGSVNLSNRLNTATLGQLAGTATAFRFPLQSSMCGDTVNAELDISLLAPL